MKKKILFGLMACLLFAGCQFDASKNEEPEKDTYKLSIVWNGYAGLENRTDDIKKTFINTYLNGSKEVKLTEDLEKNDSYRDIDLDKLDDYKKQAGLGDKSIEKGSDFVFVFDVNERYTYDSEDDYVYISSFTYYSDESLTDEIKSVVMDSDKTVYVKAYLDFTNVEKWINYVNGRTESYK